MKLIDLSLSVWIVGSLIVLLCSSPVQASLDGCTLYAGGDFSFSNSGLYSSLIGIDISTGSISPATGPGVYRDSFPDSLIYFADQLFFAGDLVRARDVTTPAIARYDFDEDDYLSVADGLQLISKVLPTSDEDLSPSVLFRAWSDDVLLIGGHFDVSGDQTGFHNLAQYDPETDLLTSVAGRLPCSECSVISLTTSSTGDIYVVTMDTSSYQTSVLTSNGVSGIWQTLSTPQLTDGTPVTLLFDNLLVGSDDAALFALGYVATTESLANKSIRFYLLRWDLTATNSNPTYTLVWQKNCQSNEISKRSYPILKKIRENLLVSVPSVSCATDTSAVSFLEFDPSNLSALTSTVSALNSYNSVTNLQIAANGDVYVSNDINVSRFLYGGHSWTSLLDDDEDIRSMVFSDDSDDLYVGHVTSDHVFQVQYIPAGRSWSWDLFDNEIYAPGKIFTISQMLDGQFLVGGDFKYVGNSNGVGVTGAKVAAVWDGVSSWIPTLPSNADSYLTGWKLIASANVGNTVYGIVDAGTGVATLPLVRWNVEDGTWMYLYHRPTITSDIAYDSSVGSIYIDHKRNQIYFGGQFSVSYDATQPVAIGMIVYSIDREAWSCMPANFTKVTALGKLNGNAYLQIGGEFSYVDSRDYTHENYLVYDIEAADFVSAIPGFPSATIYSTALFPSQTESTFLAGEFGSSGVEQLRRTSGSGTWAFAGVGNNPISPVVYSITSRNQGTVLFAGGSFPGALAMFDIARQQWSNMLTSPIYGNGLVYAVALTCPFDGENYSYETEIGYYVDDGDFGCYIPVDALYEDCYVEPLNGWQIFGLCFTVVVTLVIIAVISFFIVRNLKQRAAAAPVDFI